jgi:hypothetical protein
MTLPPVDQNIAALRAAVYLAAIPSSFAQLREIPLPDGVGLLLRLVARDDEAQQFCAAQTEKSPSELREVAAFYLEQIILAPEADSYRVLGATRNTRDAELRRNLSLLCRWLHPDVCEDLSRSLLFLRVTQAWNDLKTPERRAAYDAALARSAAPKNGAPIEKVNGARRSSENRPNQGANFCKNVQRKRMTGLRQSRPKGLWRYLIFGRGWRAR